MVIRSLVRVGFGLALSLSVFAQIRNPTGSAGNFPGSTNPNSGTSPNFPNNFPNGTSPTDLRPPLYLSGKVLLDDGTPPPDRVAVQLVCRSQPRIIGYTDRKGNFSADVHDRRSMAQYDDASENSPNLGNGRLGNTGTRGDVMNNELLGCDLQASLPGFRSDVDHLDARRSLDNPDVGTIFLHRLANVEGLTISATSALAPKDAVKALDKAREDEKKQKWADAQKELNKAVSIYPEYAAAWYELGNVQLRQNDAAAARQSYTRALDADAKFVSPYLALGDLAAREQKWQEAAENSDRALHLDPIDFPEAWLVNAFANFNLRKFDEAEKSAREGLSHDTAHHFPKMNLVLGVVLAEKQQYAAAAENLREYLHYAPNAADAAQVQKQLDEVEKAIGPQAKQQ